MCGVCCGGWVVFVLGVIASYLVVWVWVWCIWWVVMICGVVVILMLCCSCACGVPGFITCGVLCGVYRLSS